MNIYKYNIDVTEFEFKPWFRKEVCDDETYNYFGWLWFVISW